MLNLRIGFRPPFEVPGFWLYAADRPILHLLVSDDEEYSAPSHLDHISFTSVNLPVTIKRLEDLGLAYVTNHIPDFDTFQVLIRDPAGITIELNFSCEKI